MSIVISPSKQSEQPCTMLEVLATWEGFHPPLPFKDIPERDSSAVAVHSQAVLIYYVEPSINQP